MDKKTVKVAGDKVHIPAYYERAKDVPDEFKGKQVYAVQTENAFCVVLLSGIKDDGDMIYDQGVLIHAFHEVLLGDNQGLIEVGDGELDGRPYVYSIIKTLMEEDGAPMGVQYNMSMDIAKKKGSTHVQGFFTEQGVTGMRDSMVFAMRSNELGGMDAAMEGWTADPYDPQRQVGALMNLSEQEEFDSLFPEHPLSMARALVRCVLGQDADDEPVGMVVAEEEPKKKAGNPFVKAAGKLFDAASGAAGSVANKAGDAAGTVAEIAGGVAVAAAKTAGGAAGTVAHGAGTAAIAVSQGAGVAAEAISDAAGTAAGAVVNAAGGVANVVSTKAGKLADAVKEKSPEKVVKRAKVAAFKDGINEGAALMAKKAYAYSFALVALTTYAAYCDGSISEEETVQLRSSLKHLRANKDIPEPIRNQFVEIAESENLSFDDVAEYLDVLSTATLKSLRYELDGAISADGVVTPEEEAALQRFDEYVEQRCLSEVSEDE